MNFRRRTLLPALCATFAVGIAWPADWSALLSDTALTDFNDQDVRDYLDVVNSFLDAPAPVDPVEWSNPRTGAGARLELLGQPRMEGFPECRRVRTNVYSRKHKAQPRTWTACRDGDGGWRLVSAK